MARSPSDATRFTATGPYMATKPGSSTSPISSPGTRINIGGPAPANETPQQKIARLRAAAAAAKIGHESGMDRAVRIGRRVADRAHRYTALGLVGLTLISGAVATAGITDMIMHNRRRRAEWLADKQAQSARDLDEAKRAQAAGIVTEDQMLLINRERAANEAAQALKERPGIFRRATAYVFGESKKEEVKGGRLGSMASAVVDEATELKGTAREMGRSLKERGEAVVSQASDTLDRHRREGERFDGILHPVGGPLDRQAEIITHAATETTRSWKSWLTGH